MAAEEGTVLKFDKGEMIGSQTFCQMFSQSVAWIHLDLVWLEGPVLITISQWHVVIYCRLFLMQRTKQQTLV